MMEDLDDLNISRIIQDRERGEEIGQLTVSLDDLKREIPVDAGEWNKIARCYPGTVQKEAW